MPGKKTATLALDQTSPVTGDISFHATQSGFANEYLLWVSVHCFDSEGVAVSAAFLPIQWPDGTAGPFSTDAASAVRGTAYVFEYPQTATPIRGTEIDFEIG